MPINGAEKVDVVQPTDCNYTRPKFFKPLISEDMYANRKTTLAPHIRIIEKLIASICLKTEGNVVAANVDATRGMQHHVTSQRPSTPLNR